MAARSISTASLTFGLVSIPVRLFPATSSKSVRFNLLHDKDKSRIQEKIFCPVEEKIVDRSELVRGYEIEKGRYVTFTDEELISLRRRPIAQSKFRNSSRSPKLIRCISKIPICSDANPPRQRPTIC